MASQYLLSQVPFLREIHLRAPPLQDPLSVNSKYSTSLFLAKKPDRFSIRYDDPTL